MKLELREFNEDEREQIVAIASRLTSASRAVQPKIDSCLVNVSRRMDVTGAATLADYLGIVDRSSDELAHFISAITIHTTSWFRELPHFERLRAFGTDIAKSFLNGRISRPMRVLSAGSSSGEEGYSIALVLEDIRRHNPLFDYTVEGWDVDPVSVTKANKAIYARQGLSEIPSEYHKYMLVGSGKTDGLLTLDKEIRTRCKFLRRSLTDSTDKLSAKYDLIFCRNVLIYFDLEVVHSVIRGLSSCLDEQGLLCLGHSETIEAANFGLTALGHTTYKSVMATKDVPRTKENLKSRRLVKEVLRSPEIILIGASTGGTEVLTRFLQSFPKPCPPVVVVQHIAQSFARPFAERLSTSSGLPLGSMLHGAELLGGHLYMMCDDKHLGLRKDQGKFYVRVINEGHIHGVRPSVDHLFRSVALTEASRVIAIILTGMGKDGAQGMLELHRKGAITMAQDEKSSTVFGMPREAIALGAVDFIGEPTALKQRLLNYLCLKAA